MVHECLEASRRVGKSYRHYQVLIKSHFSAEYGFPFLFLCNLDKVVGPLQVEFGVLLSAINAVHDLIGARQRIVVFDSDIIEFLVINAKL